MPRRPELTFGDLAIGDEFEWPPPLPTGKSPMTKTTPTRYEFWIGTRPPDDPMKAEGTAAPHYPVRRVRGRIGKAR